MSQDFTNRTPRLVGQQHEKANKFSTLLEQGIIGAPTSRHLHLGTSQLRDMSIPLTREA